MLSETCLEVPDELSNESFIDKEHSLDYKIEKMINLVKLSRKTIFIIDSMDSDPVSCTQSNNLDDVSTKKLMLLSFLKHQTLAEFVLQAGHDGILQKSGFLPTEILEIFNPTQLSPKESEKIDLVLDNTDLVVVSCSSVGTEILKILTNKVCENSKSGLRYEDGGALGFVIIGNCRTKFDSMATLKVNSDVDATVAILINKLSISEDGLENSGRPCTSAEHRSMLAHVNTPQTEEPTSKNLQQHGILLSGKMIPEPHISEDKSITKCEDKEGPLDLKVSYLNLLMTASKRTLVLTEADTSQVFLSGAQYGAKCGMSDPDNNPSKLHYQLSALHEAGLLHAWIQHGHDGLPQRAGVPADCVTEVYNSWFSMPDDPHNLELDKMREEVEKCDLILVLDAGHGHDTGEGVTGETRSAVLGPVLSSSNTLGVVVIRNINNDGTQPPLNQSTLNIFADPNIVFNKLLETLNIVNIPTVPRNICCLHRASAMVRNENLINKIVNN